MGFPDAFLSLSYRNTRNINLNVIWKVSINTINKFVVNTIL